MDIATRNRQIKRLLEAEFGRGKVRVRGGRGTSYGWAHIDIDITPLDRDESEALQRRAAQVLKSIEFGKYYVDDGYGTEAKSRSISFNHSRYRQTMRGHNGELLGLDWDTGNWEVVAA